MFIIGRDRTRTKKQKLAHNKAKKQREEEEAAAAADNVSSQEEEQEAGEHVQDEYLEDNNLSDEGRISRQIDPVTENGERLSHLSDDWGADDLYVIRKASASEGRLYRLCLRIYEEIPPNVLPYPVAWGGRYLENKDTQEMLPNENWPNNFCVMMATVISIPVFQDNLEFLRYAIKKAVFLRTGGVENREDPVEDLWQFRTGRNAKLAEDILGHFAPDTDDLSKMEKASGLADEYLGKDLPPDFEFLDRLPDIVQMKDHRKYMPPDVLSRDIESISEAWDEHVREKNEARPARLKPAESYMKQLHTESGLTPGRGSNGKSNDWMLLKKEYLIEQRRGKDVHADTGEELDDEEMDVDHESHDNGDYVSSEEGDLMIDEEEAPRCIESEESPGIENEEAMDEMLLDEVDSATFVDTPTPAPKGKSVHSARPIAQLPSRANGPSPQMFPRNTPTGLDRPRPSLTMGTGLEAVSLQQVDKHLPELDIDTVVDNVDGRRDVEDKEAGEDREQRRIAELEKSLPEASAVQSQAQEIKRLQNEVDMLRERNTNLEPWFSESSRLIVQRNALEKEKMKLEEENNRLRPFESGTNELREQFGAQSKRLKLALGTLKNLGINLDERQVTPSHP